MSSNLSGENTQRVNQPVFHASGKAWRDFQFSRLPKVSKAHILMLESLEWLLPEVRAGGVAIEGMRRRFQELLGEKVRMGLEFKHIISPRELRKYVSDPAFICTLGAMPHKPRALLEIDIGLAHAVIGNLLGGSGDAAPLRPLTDIEEGVMSYVVIEMLKVLSPQMSSGLPRLRLEGMCDGLASAERLLGEENQLAVVQMKCMVGGQAGYLRLFVPASVLALVQAPLDEEASRHRRQELLEAHIGRLSGVEAFFRAEIGHVRISMNDLRGVGPGDVVLLDELNTRADLGDEGQARLRLGQGRLGWFDCSLSVDQGRYVAEVTGFHAGQATPSYESEQNVSSDSMGEGADLVNDIPLHLAVDLARVPTTAEEVVSLKVGQVIDLNRVPGEPVDLSVSGKVIGRGELVEVEGHLGVRITELNG